MAACLARLAMIEARGGHEAAARAHAEEGLELSRASGTHLLTIWSLSALGELETARGDVGAALRVYEQLAGMLESGGIADADISPAPEQVELHLRAGDRERAVAVTEPFRELAAVKGQPWSLARAARCTALLADDDRLDEAFGEALALHARTHDAFETARTQLAYGSRLRRAGRRQQAREQLRAALQTFDRLGAAPWADRAQHELRATGETARRRDPSTLDDLTPQELRIAVMLGDGATTRQAAAALYLSPKTVEYHLRHVYMKLGVNSRAALAEALRAGRVAPPAAGRVQE
jgi:DNA-binding CsgD family transcriptional regulator